MNLSINVFGVWTILSYILLFYFILRFGLIDNAEYRISDIKNISTKSKCIINILVDINFAVQTLLFLSFIVFFVKI